MSERLQHRNPWAEKLSQVSLPDMEGCWAAMEVTLDREMPKGWWRDWRRWLLLILILLLLIGVCECPGRRWPAAGSAAGGGGAFAKVSAPKGGTKVSGGSPVAGSPVAGSVETAGNKAAPGPEGEDVRALEGRSVRGGAVVTTAAKGETRVEAGRAGRLGRKKKTRVLGEDLAAARGDGTVPGTILPDSIQQKPAVQAPPALIPPRSLDSAAKKKRQEKPTTKQQPEKKEKQEKKGEGEKKWNDGWLAGIGLNQFFTIGGQQASSFNSSGLTGTLSDYIPIPMVRYYPEPDLYIQLEVQINTPQYTKKDLVASVSAPDSVSPVQTVQHTVSINKLFYFNVPVSVHYTVFDHLDLGAGLQYSRLTNGVGVFNSNYNTSGVDSLATETKTVKGDSVYKEIKTHEFRFLVDANYNWRHFIFGLRYNQALSKFIHVEVSPGQITQARNSSLQLYLRYILWDHRKKKPSLPAK